MGAVVTFHPVSSMVVMQHMGENLETECTSSKLDELGRITLPAELMQKMGWETRGKIAVYYVDDKTVILKNV